MIYIDKSLKEDKEAYDLALKYTKYISEIPGNKAKVISVEPNTVGKLIIKIEVDK